MALLRVVATEGRPGAGGGIVDDANKASFVRAALLQYEGPLVRYAAAITGDVERARDVVQDTFVKLCAAKPEELEGRVREWLFTVCRNRALDVQRKESRMKPLGEMELEAVESREPSPANTARPITFWVRLGMEETNDWRNFSNPFIRRFFDFSSQSFSIREF